MIQIIIRAILRSKIVSKSIKMHLRSCKDTRDRGENFARFDIRRFARLTNGQMNVNVASEFIAASLRVRPFARSIVSSNMMSFAKACTSGSENNHVSYREYSTRAIITIIAFPPRTCRRSFVNRACVCQFERTRLFHKVKFARQRSLNNSVLSKIHPRRLDRLR